MQAQVGRMLHISEEDERKINEFHKLHPVSKNRGFGRLFRSPTLFEDMVKSILLCNCRWGRSMDMARALCELQLELNSTGSCVDDTTRQYCSSSSSSLTHQNPNPMHPAKTLKRRGRRRRGGLKRKHMAADVECNKDNNICNSSSSTTTRANDDCSESSSSSKDHQNAAYGNFPSSKELVNLDEEFLERRCNLGYRAPIILRLAKIFETADMARQSSSSSSSSSSPYYDKVYKELMGVKGLGPFTSSYVLTCMGFYERIPADTETVRHLQEIHGRKSCTKKTVMEDAKEIYRNYAPFQFLAYWYV
ncbi:hypothetical protein BVC80_497g27 [Macleaya cordata]|uniref:HhH-GPD domain-containing protein n=1 Tax=Macleaya cordata TaxID=56857 RepID=A0A200Q8R5_MACCD|nr:hypothetical protein BVC80_497g27 [Macleaya cordata]